MNLSVDRPAHWCIGQLRVDVHGALVFVRMCVCDLGMERVTKEQIERKIEKNGPPKLKVEERCVQTNLNHINFGLVVLTWPLGLRARLDRFGPVRRAPSIALEGVSLTVCLVRPGSTVFIGIEPLVAQPRFGKDAGSVNSNYVESAEINRRSGRTQGPK